MSKKSERDSSERKVRIPFDRNENTFIIWQSKFKATANKEGFLLTLDGSWKIPSVSKYEAINRIQGKYMLENKKISNRKRVYEFLRRIPIRRSYNSVCYRESWFKWKASIQSRWQHRDRRDHASIEDLSKRDANAGDRTSVRTLTRMGCNPYANYFSDDGSCVFERFVIFALRENWLANYVQKLQ